MAAFRCHIKWRVTSMEWIKWVSKLDNRSFLISLHFFVKSWHLNITCHTYCICRLYCNRECSGKHGLSSRYLTIRQPCLTDRVYKLSVKQFLINKKYNFPHIACVCHLWFIIGKSLWEVEKTQMWKLNFVLSKLSFVCCWLWCTNQSVDDRGIGLAWKLVGTHGWGEMC